MQPNDNQNDNQATTTGLTPGLLGSKVRKLFRANRPSPYLVQWGSAGDRKTEAYATSTERNKRYAELVKELGTTRREVVMSRKDQNDWASFRAAVGDTPWVDVVSGWREHLAAKGRTVSTLTVEDAARKYISDSERMAEAGQLAEGTKTQKKHKVNLFAASFKGRRMCEVRSDEIEEWIDSQGHTSSGTFNSYRKHIRSFFEEFKKEVRPNPVELIERREDTVDKVEILTPQEIAKLFGYALEHQPEALGRLALEAFAGLRFGSADKVAKEDINFEDRGIMLPKHIVKTRRRFYIDALPENLWAWLDKTNDACWALENNQWMHMKSRLFAKAGVPHPRNCLRHSFATYHVAAFKDPGRTASILCHRNQQKLWSNYNGIATQSAGLRYFEITPQSWRQVAESSLSSGTPPAAGVRAA